MSKIQNNSLWGKCHAENGSQNGMQLSSSDYSRNRIHKAERREKRIILVDIRQGQLQKNSG